ncbi:D-alanyl-D-alanine carboxypeptidase, serine-type, PBP4 family [Xenococcus sp. PCC 7305]|uniref:D-alanyl-D-alanine carboxypeptidase/D-alanyl-D-alanine endopeptidase n=1 Tax=Xenococcus sp. PCC 7305 TaxID=102125 RepID=UPI0002ABD864|nr:D-alanyl-D-alanine carboxypeptidase/D-alanyl-D-alanine-endopeptidase [Xenococcus sp. PCC 7305]ELS02853.1 D-alanyl-D-alanine carboxypeptidase, serine-type, PBP4 family [Xenococcus sp. PCC 7305]
MEKGYIVLHILSIFFLGLIAPEAKSQSTPICRQNFAAIDTIVNRPEFRRSRWGIVIQDLDSECILYSVDAEKYFIPASNAKLLTTAAALLELGADFRITTPILSTGEAPFLESLIVQGQGDPSISTENLEDIAQQLQSLGITQIEKLLIDDSYFNNFQLNPTWEWLDIHSYYGTAVNSLILNENTFTLTVIPQGIGEPVTLSLSDEIAAQQWQVFNEAVTTTADQVYNIELDGVLGKPILKILGGIPVDHGADVWDLAILDPANYFLETFRQLLSQSGIRVSSAEVISQERQNSEAKLLTQIVSPPLPILLAEINQNSNNLYAEALLKILGKQVNADNDTEAVKLSLTQLGIDSEHYILKDGSGLSRHNLITPELLIKLLSEISKMPEGQIYQESLAIAHANGTLKNRFQNSPKPLTLQGKTGTLTGVSTLSGYLKTKTGARIVFSILVNNADQKNRISRQAIDEIILLIQNSY